MTEKKKRGRPAGTTKAAMNERRATATIGGVEIDIDKELASLGLLNNGGEGNFFGMQNGGRLPTLPGTLNLTVPRHDDYTAQTKWACEFRSLKFIRGPLLRRRKFIISGFKHHHEDEKVSALFDDIAKQCKLVKTLKAIQWERDTVGWVVAWPDEINLSPRIVHLLQGNIKIDRTLGFDRIILMVDQKMADAIKKYPDRFPKYFFDAINSNKTSYVKTEIELQGAYLISNTRDIGEAYPKSPLYPLFEPVKIIESLVETQYAICFAVKQLIMHVKVKGKVENNIQQFASNAQINKVAAQVLNGAKTTSIITDAGVDISFPAPDKSVFESTAIPYNQAMGRIGDNIGIPMLLVSGKAEGVSYSTATFIIKGFLQDVIDEREDLLNDFVYPWYKEIAKNLYESDPEKYSFLNKKDTDGVEEDDWQIPIVQFNETELKNIVELLAILKFLQDTGAQSVESAMEMLQLDHRTEKARKERQNKDDGWIYRPYEPSQGMSHSQSFDSPAQHAIESTNNQFELDSKVADQTNDIQNKQLDIQKQQVQIQKVSAATKAVQTNKAGTKSSAPAKTSKPAGKAGRPAKSGATPKPDKQNRNPRTSTASIDEQLNHLGFEEQDIIGEVSILDLLQVMDDPEALDKLLTPPSLKFFERYSDTEDIND